MRLHFKYRERGRIHTIVQKISNWNRAKLSADIFEIG
jgi:hypothetical protein